MADLATGKNNDLGSHCNLHLQWRSQYKVSTPSDDTQLAEQSQNSTLYLFDYRAYCCVVVTDQSLSHVQLCTPWTKACQASLSFTVSQSLLKLMSVHWADDAIQPLSSPSPPALNLSQHQGLFQWVRSSQQVAKVLELQQESFQWAFRDDFL